MLSAGTEPTMIMDPSDQPASHVMRAAPRLWFTDENGEPSNRSGVDLAAQPPIEGVVAELEANSHPRNYAAAFDAICASYAIDLQLLWLRDDPADYDGLRSGHPCDDQEGLRNDRFAALTASLERVPERREALVSLLLLSGRFTDNRRSTVAGRSA